MRPAHNVFGRTGCGQRRRGRRRVRPGRDFPSVTEYDEVYYGVFTGKSNTQCENPRTVPNTARNARVRNVGRTQPTEAQNDVSPANLFRKNRPGMCAIHPAEHKWARAPPSSIHRLMIFFFFFLYYARNNFISNSCDEYIIRTGKGSPEN